MQHHHSDWMNFWNFACRLSGAWGASHIYKREVFVSVVLSSVICLHMRLLGCWFYAIFSYVFIYLLTCNLAFFHTSWHIHLPFCFVPCHLLPFHLLSFLSVMLHLHISMVVLFVVCCIFWTIKFTLILEQIFRAQKCYSIGLHDEGAFWVASSWQEVILITWKNVAYSNFRKLIAYCYSSWLGDWPKKIVVCRVMGW